MKVSPFARRAGWTAALFGWVALSCWAFSFSFSASYFHYSLASRLPPFLAALTGAVAIPVSVYYQMRSVGHGRRGPLRAWVMHIFSCMAAVVPLGATVAILSRIRGPFHLSGDDATGAGLNFLLLVAAAMLSVLFLAVVLALKHRGSSRAA